MGYVEAMVKAAQSSKRQAQLDDLARLRLSLKTARDERKALATHRHEVSGQFIEHPAVEDHSVLMQHMALNHGLAITQAMRGSTKVARAIHDADHKAKGVVR